METPKLRLKEQPPSTNASRAWLPNRYAQPKPLSILERFRASLIRFGSMIILVIVIVSAFLIMPFRSWDDYAVWKQVQETLTHLEAQPDSLQELKSVSASAKAAQILWDQPSGVRPDKWHQHYQGARYDACYGVIQVLALGLIKHGNEARGISELDRLHQRTGLRSLPNLPCTDQVITTCTKCRKGKIEEQCPVCKGQRECGRCDGQGFIMVPAQKSSFPLTATLRNTRQANPNVGEALTIRHNCPNCQGSGKCTACAGAGNRTVACSRCGGHVVRINFAADPNLFQNTVRGTITAIEKSMTLGYAIHVVANVQRAFLRRSGEVSNGVMSAIQGDTVLKSTNSVESLVQPFRTNTLGEGEVRIDHNGAAADQGATMQDSVDLILKKACETLQHTPLSMPDLQILADVSKSATNKPALRRHAMAAFGVSLLLQGNTNAFTRVAQIHKTVFPDLPPLLTITEDDYIGICDACLGKGEKDTACPSCMGPNKCKTCNGTGKIAAGDGFVPCESCRLREICTMCKGQKLMHITCYTCKGAGKIFKLNDNVRNNYNALLANTAAICQENIAFAEQLDNAKRERNSLLRIQMVQAITNRFQHSPDLPQVTALLDTALKERDSRTNTFVEPAALKPSQGEEVSLRKTAKRVRKQPVLKILTGLAALVCCLLVIHRLWRKQQAQSFSALPGMDKINKADFTDPLSLTSQDSRSRDKPNKSS